MKKDNKDKGSKPYQRPVQSDLHIAILKAPEATNEIPKNEYVDLVATKATLETVRRIIRAARPTDVIWRSNLAEVLDVEYTKEAQE